MLFSIRFVAIECHYTSYWTDFYQSSIGIRVCWGIWGVRLLFDYFKEIVTQRDLCLWIWITFTSWAYNWLRIRIQIDQIGIQNSEILILHLHFLVILCFDKRTFFRFIRLISSLICLIDGMLSSTVLNIDKINTF